MKSAVSNVSTRVTITCSLATEFRLPVCGDGGVHLIVDTYSLLYPNRHVLPLPNEYPAAPAHNRTAAKYSHGL